tara:strand:+ start:179 stop:553 length:375 start_codon:yes stop_codon:yes gene_type:complete
MDIAKGGRPTKSLSQDEVTEIETLGAVLNKTQLAEYFGMTEKTFRAVEERQPEVFTAYRKAKAKAIAKAGSALMKGINRGDMRAIQFFLKTQAGWTEKNHLQLSKVETPEEGTNVTLTVIGADD